MRRAAPLVLTFCILGCAHDPNYLHDDEADILRLRDEGDLLGAADAAHDLAIRAEAGAEGVRVRWTWEWIATWARRFELRMRREAGDPSYDAALLDAAHAATRLREPLPGGWPSLADHVALERLENAILPATPIATDFLERIASALPAVEASEPKTIESYVDIASGRWRLDDLLGAQAAVRCALREECLPHGDVSEAPIRREGPAWGDEMTRLMNLRTVARRMSDALFREVSEPYLIASLDPVADLAADFLARPVPPPSTPERAEYEAALARMVRETDALAAANPTRLGYLRLALAARTRIFIPDDLAALEDLAAHYLAVLDWKQGQDADARAQGAGAAAEVRRALDASVSASPASEAGSLARVVEQLHACLDDDAIPCAAPPRLLVQAALRILSSTEGARTSEAADALDLAVRVLDRARALSEHEVLEPYRARCRDRCDHAWADVALARLEAAQSFRSSVGESDAAVLMAIVDEARGAASRIADPTLRARVLAQIAARGGPISTFTMPTDE